MCAQSKFSIWQVVEGLNGSVISRATKKFQLFTPHAHGDFGIKVYVREYTSTTKGSDNAVIQPVFVEKPFRQSRYNPLSVFYIWLSNIKYSARDQMYYILLPSEGVID